MLTKRWYIFRSIFLWIIISVIFIIPSFYIACGSRPFITEVGSNGVFPAVCGRGQFNFEYIYSYVEMADSILIPLSLPKNTMIVYSKTISFILYFSLFILIGYLRGNNGFAKEGIKSSIKENKGSEFGKEFVSVGIIVTLIYIITLLWVSLLVLPITIGFALLGKSSLTGDFLIDAGYYISVLLTLALFIIIIMSIQALIGLLKRKEWSRKIVMGLAFVILGYSVLNASYIAVALSKGFTRAFSAFGLVLELIYISTSILVLYFMIKNKKSRNFFRPQLNKRS